MKSILILLFVLSQVCRVCTAYEGERITKSCVISDGRIVNVTGNSIRIVDPIDGTSRSLGFSFELLGCVPVRNANLIVLRGVREQVVVNIDSGRSRDLAWFPRSKEITVASNSEGTICFAFAMRKPAVKVQVSKEDLHLHENSDIPELLMVNERELNDCLENNVRPAVKSVLVHSISQAIPTDLVPRQKSWVVRIKDRQRIDEIIKGDTIRFRSSMLFRVDPDGTVKSLGAFEESTWTTSEPDAIYFDR